VLSFGRDGTARLWDVGGGREIVGRRWRAPRGVPILCGCLGYDWAGGGGDNDNDNDNDNDGPVAEGSGGASLDGEVGTSGKVVFVGMQDGSVRGYELSTGRARFFSSGVSPTLTGSKTAPIDSTAFSAENRVLVVGRRDGVIMLWDLTAPSPSSTSTSTSTTPGSDGVVRGDERDCTPTSVFTRNGAGIESLAFSPSVGPNDRFPSILVGAEDGLFCRIAIDANGVPKLEQEFVGGEAGDGVRVVRALMSEGREVDWSAGDDGCVRRY
jgi:proteasomal ATPase-associated factor 1